MKAKSKIEPGRPEFMIGAREYADLNDVRACSRSTK